MDQKDSPLPSLSDVKADSWYKLAQKKIYFGHQSVGKNIIDGLAEIVQQNSHINLNIRETSDSAHFSMPVFAHARVGKNTQPDSKIEAFTHAVESEIGNQADIAFFKFCYVDISFDSDVPRIFKNYTSALVHLEKSFPQTTFVHVTVPLTAYQPPALSKLKRIIKLLLGLPVGGIDDNIKRHDFNELMRKEYGKKGNLFDLARIESTLPDGTRCVFRKSGKTFPVLLDEYTADGGHLNQKGRSIIAEQLLIFLAFLS